MIEEHQQTTTIHLVECVPPHPPRESDPHYRAFHQAHDRLKKLGKLVCWISNADCAGDIELHHDKVEFSQQGCVDVQKFDEAYGLNLTDEDFLAWIEGEGNLLPLCRMHHIGVLGIHIIPYPLWLLQKYLKAGMTAPAHAVVGGKK